MQQMYCRGVLGMQLHVGWAKTQNVGKPKSVNVDRLPTVEQRAFLSSASRSPRRWPVRWQAIGGG